MQMIATGNQAIFRCGRNFGEGQGKTDEGQKGKHLHPTVRRAGATTIAPLLICGAWTRELRGFDGVSILAEEVKTRREIYS
jgi:hypothetical protein